MITLVFLARIREQLQCSRMELEFAEGLGSLAALQDYLYDTQGEKWREVLGADNIIRAVNQEVVDADAVICDGDEVAFFPPVTGG